MWLVGPRQRLFSSGEKIRTNCTGQPDLDPSRGRVGREAGGHRGRTEGLWRTGLLDTEGTLGRRYHLFQGPEATDRAGCGASETEPPPCHHWAAELGHMTSAGLLPGSLCPPFPECLGPDPAGPDFAVNSGAPWWQAPERHEGRLPDLRAHLRAGQCGRRNLFYQNRSVLFRHFCGVKPASASSSASVL